MQSINTPLTLSLLSSQQNYPTDIARHQRVSHHLPSGESPVSFFSSCLRRCSRPGFNGAINCMNVYIWTNKKSWLKVKDSKDNLSTVDRSFSIRILVFSDVFIKKIYMESLHAFRALIPIGQHTNPFMCTRYIFLKKATRKSPILFFFSFF